MNQTEEIEMTYKDLKNKIKEEQKTLAQQIRRGKDLRKPCNRTDVAEEDRALYYSAYGDSDGFANWKIEGLTDDYRHKHIAYCMFFFNTPYDLIESNCNEGPDFDTVDSYKNEWEGKLDEALRDCA